LHDFSLCNLGYYTEPSFSQRSLDIFNGMFNECQEPQNDEEVETPQEDEKVEETSEKVENDTEKAAETSENEPENQSDEQEDEQQEQEKVADEKVEEHNEEKNTNINKNTNHNIMSTRFSLLKAIRDVANGRSLDEATRAVVDAGANEMRKAGVEVTGQIQLPTEMRADAAITVAAEGEDVVVTDFTNILEPLYTKNVLNDLGAHILTGLVGDVQIPVMSASNVYWEDETSSAQNGKGAFTHVKLQPHRLSAYIDISKQFLAQDSLGAEELIRRDLINAIAQKLEDTIFTADAASGNVPAGIFNGATAKEVADYAGICDLEADLEDENVYGPYKYLLTPSAKATLRSMIKGTNATGMVLENGEVDGVPAYSTGHMSAGDIAFGAWDNLYVGQWGAIDLTVDPYTQAGDGKIRLVINAFFDYKLVRPEAVVLANFEE
jgi:HK97 family phage major capsid protein